ncbi:Cas9 inhibitor AcrIIA9 family protein [Phocaeicola plebeius]|uniref:Cas9 inhibitor AcrIIA9 family protein n=1 Tax=Phocaeicola plebeius TaxID=310297 RepID=UPI002942BE36|nr:Cas9 inhibitor AcrIIA9 family protein [Phocaeicola plebeius]
MEAVSMEQAIKIYLDNRAKTDSLFAETYRKANKSIEECIKYIYSKARKLAKGGNAVGVDEATVYGWAVHYYDEDSIKVDKVQERVEVVAPATVQEPVVQEPVKEEKPVKQKSARKKTKQELQKIFDSRQLSLFDM